jgi:hypothetical protein
MKRKYWWFFGGIQLAGTLVGMGASHGDRISSCLSFLLLLPGILVSLPFFTPGHIGNSWPEWTLFAIAFAANLLVFAATSILLARRRKSN